MTNFEQPIDRLGSNSVKWDAILKSYNEENLFAVVDCRHGFQSARRRLVQAYQKLLEHGILGYADTPDTLLYRYQQLGAGNILSLP